MKRILSTLLLLLCACIAHADRFSYLYIQGDKQTPFYVKLEEAMQPRYGKNYCIIPMLAQGPAHIEILFQQNAFPAQQFTVLMPEGGSRGFLLVKKDTGFSLYDLQQGFYLPAGNREDDDRLPVIAVAAAITPPGAPTIADPVEPKPAVEKDQPAFKHMLQKKPKPAPQQPETQTTDGSPVFIRDLELGSGAQQAAGDTAVSVHSSNATRAVTPSIAITNTDCPAPLSSAEFGKIFTTLSGYKEDEERLEYLGGQMDFCYETWQARTMAGKLSSDVARYELLKKIYPRITDQAAFPLLDDLLTSDTWKAAFTRLVQH